MEQSSFEQVKINVTVINAILLTLLKIFNFRALFSKQSTATDDVSDEYNFFVRVSIMSIL